MKREKRPQTKSGKELKTGKGVKSLSSLAQEMRRGFKKVDGRLELLEEGSRRHDLMFEQLAKKTDDGFHRVGLLFEHLETKIDAALEHAQTTTDNAATLKDHGRRIEDLETNVGAIRGAIRSTKI